MRSCTVKNRAFMLKYRPPGGGYSAKGEMSEKKEGCVGVPKSSPTTSSSADYGRRERPKPWNWGRVQKEPNVGFGGVVLLGNRVGNHRNSLWKSDR